MKAIIGRFYKTKELAAQEAAANKARRQTPVILENDDGFLVLGRRQVKAAGLIKPKYIKIAEARLAAIPRNLFDNNTKGDNFQAIAKKCSNGGLL